MTGAAIASSPRGRPGKRAAAAADALDEYPVLREARDRLIAAVEGDAPQARVVAAVEADPSLALRILTAANRRRAGAGKVASIPDAVRLLGPDELVSLTSHAPALDLLAPGARWARLPERLRLRAVTAHRACWRLAVRFHREECDALVAGALLHDVGHAAMRVMFDAGDDDDPEAERALYGTDHAELGAMALRLHRLPEALTELVAQHHDPRADGDAAMVRAAALLARFA